MKFLIDECLSPDLVQIAGEFPESTRVRFRGLQGRPDWVIVQRAVNENFVLVTNNARDFKRLVGSENIHCGLVCLIVSPSLASRQSQCDLFQFALNELGCDEPVNEVIEITLHSNSEVTTERYPWPSDNQEFADDGEIV